MADRVLPSVRLMLWVDHATIDLADGKWTLKHPRASVFLPPGKTFPFREAESWVYVQLTGGLGRWELAVELRQKRDDGTYRSVGIGPVSAVEFDPGPRLVVKEQAFEFRRLPFREEGLYEFRVVAAADDGSDTLTYQALNGEVAEVRVLDPKGAL